MARFVDGPSKSAWARTQAERYEASIAHQQRSFSPLVGA